MGRKTWVQILSHGCYSSHNPQPPRPQDQPRRCTLLEDYGFSWCVHIYFIHIHLFVHPHVLRNDIKKECMHTHMSLSVSVSTHTFAYTSVHSNINKKVFNIETPFQMLALIASILRALVDPFSK